MERLRGEGVPDRAMPMDVQIDAELKCPAISRASKPPRDVLT